MLDEFTASNACNRSRRVAKIQIDKRNQTRRCPALSHKGSRIDWPCAVYTGAIYFRVVVVWSTVQPNYNGYTDYSQLAVEVR